MSIKRIFHKKPISKSIYQKPEALTVPRRNKKTRKPAKKHRDMFTDFGYVPHADAITESAFDLIKSHTVRVR